MLEEAEILAGCVVKAIDRHRASVAALTWRRSSAATIAVMSKAGHSSMATTKRYLHIAVSSSTTRRRARTHQGRRTRRASQAEGRRRATLVGVLGAIHERSHDTEPGVGTMRTRMCWDSSALTIKPRLQARRGLCVRVRSRGP